MSDLVRDLGEVIARHPEVSGREFQRAAQEAAEGYFPADDLEPQHDVTDALLAALGRLPDLK